MKFPFVTFYNGWEKQPELFVAWSLAYLTVNKQLLITFFNYSVILTFLR